MPDRIYMKIGVICASLIRLSVGKKRQVCLAAHRFGRSRGLKSRLVKQAEDDKGRWGRLLSSAFKRPAAAVWGNGLWGSVGAAGRSYD